MLQNTSAVKFCLGMVTCILLTPHAAHAYLDPGLGSILLQGVIAALSTVMVSITLGWQHIKKAFRSITGKKDE